MIHAVGMKRWQGTLPAVQGGCSVDVPKVAVVGAGGMGALLAERIPRSYRKVVISRRKAEAVAVADEVGGIASNQYSAVRGCGVIFLAVPDDQVLPVLGELAPHVDPRALLVNTALTVMTEELAGAYPNLRFAAVKVVGDPAEMALRGTGAVLLDHVTEEEEARLRQLVAGLGPVARGSEEAALAAVSAIAEEMTRALAGLKERLGALGLSDGLSAVAVASAGPGVLRSLAMGQPNPFTQGVLDRLRNREASAP